MAYTYSDYKEYPRGSATYFVRLRKFIREITDLIGNATAADGFSESSQELVQLRKDLEDELDRAEKEFPEPDAAGNTAPIRRGRLRLLRVRDVS